MLIMIMPANLQDSSPTNGLHPHTVLQLQRLVLLTNESRDAYQLAANLATDPQIVALSQRTAFERHSQAMALQNVLWCNGNESKSRSPIETERDRRIHQVLNEWPERLNATLFDELLKIDQQLYSCYEKVQRTIPGRGIRQLLSEHALCIQRLPKIMLDLQHELEKQNSSESNCRN